MGTRPPLEDSTAFIEAGRSQISDPAEPVPSHFLAAHACSNGPPLVSNSGSVSADISKPASGHRVAVYSGNSTESGAGEAIVLFGKLSGSSDLAPFAARQLCELSKFLLQVESVGKDFP